MCRICRAGVEFEITVSDLLTCSLSCCTEDHRYGTSSLLYVNVHILELDAWKPIFLLPLLKSFILVVNGSLIRAVSEGFEQVFTVSIPQFPVLLPLSFAMTDSNSAESNQNNSYNKFVK